MTKVLLGLEHREYKEDYKMGLKGRQGSGCRRPYELGEGVKNVFGRVRGLWKVAA